MASASKATGSAAEQLDEVIAKVIARAPALIAAGVCSLAVDGITITLAAAVPRPQPPVATPPEPKPVAKQHVDPMRDPSTYPGGRVPGFTREEDKP